MSPAAFAIAFALGLAATVALDRLSAARGLLPPGFRAPWRRLLAGALLATFFALTVFLPLSAALAGQKIEPPSLSAIGTFQLFELHVVMVGVLAAWFLLGFAVRHAPAPVAPIAAPAVPIVADEPGADPYLDPPPPVPIAAPAPPAPPPSLGRQFLIQFGFVAPDVPREVGLGLVLGLAIWLAVVLALIAIAGVLMAVGGEKMVPKQPPALIPLIAGLPFLLRFAVSLSAGVVEETFFRGFLQPRMGLVLSTACFALAHLSYGQPFLLVGITLLSLIYGFLVRWRQSIWAAMAAHALFDGVQLLIVVPAVLKMTHGAAGKAAALLPGLLG